MKLQEKFKKKYKVDAIDFVEKARNIIKNEGGRVYYSSWW